MGDGALTHSEGSNIALKPDQKIDVVVAPAAEITVEAAA